ncbi:alpha/beta hydrolase [Cellulophaga baltica]|uniref:alpha/beta fold hydrolase n=1 Tax=Cellulophaga TaxID=104264 RepID=UPI001C073178|nr:MULTISPECIES: alpha/beta hydrolase [Cellulophaga]MBU2994860.1 alpha/beta hydrolase [Cellulophaga baltica]MDO6766255.1 alpha/beta hydrolase [Cellulophaga sp. 1_MG-2023]
MKKLLAVHILIFISILYTSCTVLQWRKTDKELKEKFDKLNIESTISYFKVDSLNLKTRIFSVTPKENNNINFVFFHGSPSSLSAWEGYLADSILRTEANMYAIDRPGYGYSNFGDEMTSIDKQAQIMSTIINENQLKNVIVVGSSYGGPLAARVGYLNKNVKAVVMISPAIDPDNEKDVWAARFTQWFLTRWLVPTAYRVAGDEKKVHAEELALLENDWNKITIPVLHFHGDKDELVPYENINYTKENFKNIKIITVPEKGHEIAWKHREIIIPYLIRLAKKTQVEN